METTARNANQNSCRHDNDTVFLLVVDSLLLLQVATDNVPTCRVGQPFKVDGGCCVGRSRPRNKSKERGAPFHHLV